MEKLFKEELQKLGVPGVVADRLLLVRSRRGYIAWLALRYIDKRRVNFSLRFLSDIMDEDYDRIHHSYYYRPRLTDEEIRAIQGFDEIMRHAMLLHPDEGFWMSLMTVCHKEVRQVMIGQMLLSGMSVDSVAKLTGLTFRTVYKLRAPFVVEFLKLKAYDSDSL